MDQRVSFTRMKDYCAHHFGGDVNGRDRLPLGYFEPLVRRIFAQELFKYDRANVGLVGG